jgi:hypothetical protein
MELTSDRSFTFPVAPAVLWAAIGDVGRYQVWWPWLTLFEARGLHTGEVWRCRVRPRLPYPVRFAVHLRDVEPCRRVAATVDGDLTGTAELTVAPAPGGCRVHLVSRLSPRARGLWLLTALTRPLARRGHDWILDAGARQFADRALPG